VFQKILFITTFTLFLFQVCFSIYYSNTIVVQNLTLATSKKTLNQLLLDNQNLKSHFFHITSLKTLEEYAQSKTYQPIINSLK